MFDQLREANPVVLAFVATLGTYLLTALGTLPVFLFRDAPRRLMDAMMGFAAGVMTAASCWSLLVPAIDRGGVMPAVDSSTSPIRRCLTCTASFRRRQLPRGRASRGSDRHC